MNDTVPGPDVPASRSPGGERWRIGVLARRVGLSESLLRAWEMRYGLLSPVRSTSGYRLYGPEDERRIRAMVEARGRGVPAGRAAAEVLAAERTGTFGDVSPDLDPHASGNPEDHDAVRARLQLHAAMATYDAAAMHETIDRVLRAASVESTIRDVLLPFMHEVGRGWAAGEVDIADEHFATEVVRSRLAALSAGGNAPTGPLVLLACPAGESHDLGLKGFEVILQRSGWRTCYLGPNTPSHALLTSARTLRPDLVVLAATRRSAFVIDDDDLRELRSQWPVAIGGAGADAALAASWGVTHLVGDPVVAARSLLSQTAPAPAGPGRPARHGSCCATCWSGVSAPPACSTHPSPSRLRTTEGTP